MSTLSNKSIKVTFKSRINSYKKVLDFFILPTICDSAPEESIPREKLNIPVNWPLADPEFFKPSEIDLIIGSGTTVASLSIGKINISLDDNDFFLQKTRFGWVAAGGTNFSSHSEPHNKTKCMLSEVRDIIEKFWQTEEINAQSEISNEESICEEHFKKNIKRDKTGRYIVSLPFKKNIQNLGNSRDIALQQFLNLQKRFNKDPRLEKEYSAVINEYLKLGHAEILHNPVAAEGFYLPHHVVIKPTSNTTKYRVVFNASAKSSTGISLNDTFLKTPILQKDLFVLLLQSRFYRYLILADIEKMYRQFLVEPKQRIYQKFFWSINNQIVECMLNPLTFGFAPAAYLAIRCLLQLVDDEGDRFPLAATIIKQQLYLDNMIVGTNSIEEGREIHKQIVELLKCGCLAMRQWASNEPSILQEVDEAFLDKDFRLFSDDCISKTLGLNWKAKDDMFLFSILSPENQIRITKRIILSDISKIFDPLGFLGPVILWAKLLMQELWKAKIDWEETVPSDIYYKWLKFCKQIILLTKFSIPRIVIIIQFSLIEIRGFCDACLLAYGACLYIRTISSDGRIQVSLLCSKSRVAPLKSQTIPRLELNAALLLARLYKYVTDNLTITFNKAYFWSDNEIVLHWINTQPQSLKMYVANRISEIQKITNVSQWRHVPTQYNPTDLLSRGALPNALMNNEMWLTGPEFLRNSEEHWPKINIQFKSNPPESRTVQCLISKTLNSEILENFKKYSCFKKLNHIVSYLFRFNPRFRSTGPLSITEIEHAKIVIIRILQYHYFKREIDQINNGKTIDKTSSLIPLNPFICKNQLLRIGGRLSNAKLSFDSKYPIILPRSNFLNDLIIRYYHVKNNHSGTQSTLYAIRTKFWLINGKNQIKNVLHKCINCFRVKPVLSQYLMGNLPSVRTTLSRPFLNVGIDYCGPFLIKERKRRNKNFIKVYVAVFVCMAIKAIHLEVVNDLTTDAFLAALRRFIARRGKPQSIYCDNGTNFQGARNELRELYDLLTTENHQNSVINFAQNNLIDFHFIPPSSPHFGGLWEAAVKGFKNHLKRVAANATFTFIEFYTLVIEIESILNSRPLTPISNDPKDLLALTPGHFIINDSLTNIPEQDFSSLPSNRLSAWQLITKIREDFWKRWHKEYINNINVRQKWVIKNPNLQKGTLVLIKDDNTPSLQWSMGRVVDLHPGTDNVVRTVTLQKKNGELKRPVNKLAPLPIDAPIPSKDGNYKG